MTHNVTARAPTCRDQATTASTRASPAPMPLAHGATPAQVALRKHLPELASRTNVAPAYAEDLAAATAFYSAHRRPLLWITESGISERGNAVIEEIRKADEWGLRARDFPLPPLPAGAVSPAAGGRDAT